MAPASARWSSRHGSAPGDPALLRGPATPSQAGQWEPPHSHWSLISPAPNLLPPELLFQWHGSLGSQVSQSPSPGAGYSCEGAEGSPEALTHSSVPYSIQAGVQSKSQQGKQGAVPQNAIAAELACPTLTGPCP